MWDNIVEVTVDENDTKWLNEKHIKENLRHAHLPVITRKYPLDIEKKTKTSKLNNFQLCRKFLQKKLAVTVIADCRTTEFYKRKRKLGFNLHDVIKTKKQTLLESIKYAFEEKHMQTQYSVIFMITKLQ